MPSLAEIGPVVLEKKMKMWKVYNNANDDNDNGLWSEKLTWAYGSGELKMGFTVWLKIHNLLTIANNTKFAPQQFFLIMLVNYR